MSRKLLGILALLLIAAPGTIHAQSRWRFEIRDAALGTGFGFEGTVGYRFQPHIWAYAGWDWHRFSDEASFAGSENDFEETGYAFGLQFEHPIGRSEAAALQLRPGGTYSHVEIENSAGDLVTDSEHGLGWETGAALAVRLANGWQTTPGVRFRSLSRDFTVGSATTPKSLRYLAAELGVSRSF